MPRRILYTRRLLQCSPAHGPCAICHQMLMMNLYDADLLARVCLPCGDDSGVAEIYLSRAMIAQPDDTLIRRNP